MLVRCIAKFRDLKTPGKPKRRIGDTWEATPERLHELRCSRYGVLAEEVAERHAESARAPQTVESAPTAEELEGKTVRQLVELCINEGVETHGRPRKAELLDALKAHYGLE